MKKRLVTLVGPWPAPIGGVSTFCSRLALKDNGELIGEILDIYEGQKNSGRPAGLSYLQPKLFPSLRWIWLYLKVSLSDSHVIHFNFSNARSIFFCLLPIKGNRRWILMLHGGNLSINGRLRSWIASLIMQRFDIILSLSDKQNIFYNELKAVDVFRVSSYIHLIKFNRLPSPAMKSWTAKSRAFKKYFVASGYPTQIYNHLDVIRSVTRHKDAFLALFLSV